MEFSPDQGPGQPDHRCQGYYHADVLYYLGEIGERKKHAAKEKHWCHKQSEIVVKAVKRRDKRSVKNSNRRKEHTSQE